MKFKEVIIENKQKIGLALLGLTAVGVITYLFVKKSKKSSTPTPVGSSQSQNASILTSEVAKQLPQQQPIISSHDQKFARIVNEIRGMLDANGYKLTPQVITVIIRGQYELGNQEMRNLTFNSRKERRQKLGDGLQFAKIVARSQFELQQIQEKHLGALLSRFNIDKATWKEATNEWQNKNSEDDLGLGDLIKSQEDKLLLSYRNPNSKANDFSTLEKIMKYKVKILQTLNPNDLGIDLGADAAAKYDLIETYVNDLVFNKFTIEAEDLEYSIEQLNKQEKEKVVEYEDKITELMESYVGEDDEGGEGDFY